MRTLPSSESGVTIVEFAILLPFFVTLLFGIIEFGQALFFQTALQHAVTLAARCATVYSSTNTVNSTCGTNSGIQTYAVTQAYGLNIAATRFTPTSSTSQNCVSAAFPFNFSIPFMPNVFALNLTAQSCYPK
jgi:Flp pilus assembly protein TadG